MTGFRDLLGLLLLSDVNIWILGSITVSEQLHTYPSPQPNLTPPAYSWLLLVKCKGRCGVAQILIFIHSPGLHRNCYIRFLFVLHFKKFDRYFKKLFPNILLQLMAMTAMKMHLLVWSSWGGRWKKTWKRHQGKSLCIKHLQFDSNTSTFHTAIGS